MTSTVSGRRQDCRMDGSGCFTGGLGIPRHAAPGQCGGHQKEKKRFTSHSYTVLRVNSTDENDSFRKGNALVLQYIMLIIRFSNPRWTQCRILSSGWRFLPMNRKVQRPDGSGGTGNISQGPEAPVLFSARFRGIGQVGFGGRVLRMALFTRFAGAACKGIYLSLFFSKCGPTLIRK